MNPTQRAGDEGASLLLVLVVLMVVSVVVTGLLGFADVSVTASGDVRSIRQQNYSSDAAIELGISRVLDDENYGAVGHACPSFTFSGANGVSSTVTCDAANGTSGVPTGRVRNAILTLSGTDDLVLLGQDPLYVTGNVYSHASIDPDTSNNSILSVTGRVTSHNSSVCSEVKITATQGKRCVGSSSGGDPGWSPGTALLVPGTATCVTPGKKVVLFTPGKYTVNPTSMIPGGCNPDTLYFGPGVYYLEAAFNTGNYDVVAGTATGNWATKGNKAPTDDTACDQALPGVQFLLGGNGAIVMPNQVQTMTICAGPNPATQPAIAVYGVQTTGGGLQAHSAAVGFDTDQKKPSVFVHGTIYMRDSQARLSVFNKAKTYYTGGFVTSSLVADISASSKLVGDPISIPPCTAVDPCVSNRQVEFTSAVGSNTWVKALVDVDDGFGATPGSSAKTTSWSVRR